MASHGAAKKVGLSFPTGPGYYPPQEKFRRVRVFAVNVKASHYILRPKFLFDFHDNPQAKASRAILGFIFNAINDTTIGSNQDSLSFNHPLFNAQDKKVALLWQQIPSRMGDNNIVAYRFYFIVNDAKWKLHEAFLKQFERNKEWWEKRKKQRAPKALGSNDAFRYLTDLQKFMTFFSTMHEYDFIQEAMKSHEADHFMYNNISSHEAAQEHLFDPRLFNIESVLNPFRPERVLSLKNCVESRMLDELNAHARCRDLDEYIVGENIEVMTDAASDVAFDFKYPFREHAHVLAKFITPVTITKALIPNIGERREKQYKPSNDEIKALLLQEAVYPEVEALDFSGFREDKTKPTLTTDGENVDPNGTDQLDEDIRRLAGELGDDDMDDHAARFGNDAADNFAEVRAAFHAAQCIEEVEVSPFEEETQNSYNPIQQIKSRQATWMLREENETIFESLLQLRDHPDPEVRHSYFEHRLEAQLAAINKWYNEWSDNSNCTPTDAAMFAFYITCLEEKKPWCFKHFKIDQSATHALNLHAARTLQVDAVLKYRNGHGTFNLAWFASLSRFEYHWRMKFNILFVGPAMASKSYTLHNLKKLTVPGTCQEEVRRTDASGSSATDSDGFMIHWHEMNLKEVYGKDGEETGSASFKAVLTDSMYILKEFYWREPTGNDANGPRNRIRATRYTATSAIEVLFVATNEHVENVKLGAVLSRFLVIDMRTEVFDDSRLLNRNDPTEIATLIETMEAEDKFLFKRMQHEYQVETFYVYIIETFIKMKIIRDVELEFFKHVARVFFDRMATYGRGSNNKSIRTMERMIMLARTLCIVRSIERVFHSELATVRDKIQELGRLDFSHFLHVEPHLVVDFQDSILALTYMAPAFEKPMGERILHMILYLFSNGYRPGEDHRKEIINDLARGNTSTELSFFPQYNSEQAPPEKPPLHCSFTQRRDYEDAVKAWRSKASYEFDYRVAKGSLKEIVAQTAASLKIQKSEVYETLKMYDQRYAKVPTFTSTGDLEKELDPKTGKLVPVMKSLQVVRLTQPSIDGHDSGSLEINRGFVEITFTEIIEKVLHSLGYKDMRETKVITGIMDPQQPCIHWCIEYDPEQQNFDDAVKLVNSEVRMRKKWTWALRSGNPEELNYYTQGHNARPAFQLDDQLLNQVILDRINECYGEFPMAEGKAQMPDFITHAYPDVFEFHINVIYDKHEKNPNRSHIKSQIYPYHLLEESARMEFMTKEFMNGNLEADWKRTRDEEDEDDEYAGLAEEDRPKNKRRRMTEAMIFGRSDLLERVQEANEVRQRKKIDEALADMQHDMLEWKDLRLTEDMKRKLREHDTTDFIEGNLITFGEDGKVKMITDGRTTPNRNVRTAREKYKNSFKNARQHALWRDSIIVEGNRFRHNTARRSANPNKPPAEEGEPPQQAGPSTRPPRAPRSNYRSLAAPGKDINGRPLREPAHHAPLPEPTPNAESSFEDDDDHGTSGLHEINNDYDDEDDATLNPLAARKRQRVGEDMSESADASSASARRKRPRHSKQSAQIDQATAEAFFQMPEFEIDVQEEVTKARREKRGGFSTIDGDAAMDYELMSNTGF